MALAVAAGAFDIDISRVLHVEWLTYRRCTSLCCSVACTES